MNRHPGGIQQTMHMLRQIHLPETAVCLDLGAGEGETVQYLRSRGYQALGIDKRQGRQDMVVQGDFLDLPFEAAGTDLCISQCAFFCSGDQLRAMQQAYRVLKPGGFLLLADLDQGDLEYMAVQCGFTVLQKEDLSPIWKQYFIEAIWNDTLCNEEYGCLLEANQGRKLRYTTLILRKGGKDGLI